MKKNFAIASILAIAIIFACYGSVANQLINQKSVKDNSIHSGQVSKKASGLFKKIPITPGNLREMVANANKNKKKQVTNTKPKTKQSSAQKVKKNKKSSKKTK